MTCHTCIPMVREPVVISLVRCACRSPFCTSAKNLKLRREGAIRHELYGKFHVNAVSSCCNTGCCVHETSGRMHVGQEGVEHVQRNVKGDRLLIHMAKEECAQLHVRKWTGHRRGTMPPPKPHIPCQICNINTQCSSTRRVRRDGSDKLSPLWPSALLPSPPSFRA